MHPPGPVQSNQVEEPLLEAAGHLNNDGLPEEGADKSCWTTPRKLGAFFLIFLLVIGAFVIANNGERLSDLAFMTIDDWCLWVGLIGGLIPVCLSVCFSLASSEQEQRRLWRESKQYLEQCSSP